MTRKERTDEIRRKREVLRELYGGSMTLTQLVKEIGGSWESARKFGVDHGLAFQVGKRTRYDTDAFARVIVDLRDFY